MPYSIRPAKLQDETTLQNLLPLLADFDVPPGRTPEDLWLGDAKMLVKALNGVAKDSHIIVATDDNDAPVAVSMYTIKPELLSGDLSAHLEVLAVDKNHMRQGLGKKLIDATSSAAVELGATCMSLHVFSNNKRARALYESCGFDEELIRCHKPLTKST